MSTYYGSCVAHPDRQDLDEYGHCPACLKKGKMPIQRSCADNCNNFVSGFSNRKWRRNGKTQYWKRTPERFRVPVKHGMYAYDAITETTEGVWCAEHDDEAGTV